MKDDLEVLREELELAVGGLDAEQTQFRPLGTEEKWTIQQIVGHLLRTYAATEKAVDARLLRREPTEAKITLVELMGQTVLFGLGYFPRGRLAPEAVCAPQGEEAAPAGILIAQVGLAMSAMNKKLVAAGALFGTRSRAINHAVLGPLTVDQWAKFHLVHGRHHIRQIASIRRQHGLRSITS